MWTEIILGLSGSIMVAYSIMQLYFSLSFIKLPTHSLEFSRAFDLPPLTIVVPFRNEKANLEDCVQSLLLAVKGMETYQIILINDHSNDGSEKTARQLAKTIEAVDFYDSKGNGKKFALSQAVEQAKYEWIFTCDADCIYSEGSISQLLQQVTQRKLDIGCLPVVSDGSENLLEAYDALESHGMQAITSVALDSDLFLSASGAAFLYPKSIFLQLQPYEENYHIHSGDDQFFLYAYRQVYQKRIFFYKNPGITVRTKSHQGWKELLTQRLRWSGKSTHLKDQKLKTILGLSIASDITIILLLLSSIFINNILFGAIFLWLLKMLAEAILLTLSSIYWKCIKPLKYLPIVALIRPFVQMCLLIFYFTNRRNYWKGRLISVK